MINHQVGKRSSEINKKLMKHQVDEVSSWRNVLAPFFTNLLELICDLCLERFNRYFLLNICLFIAKWIERIDKSFKEKKYSHFLNIKY
jgi:hypothetical protein